jgi:hypothetical protein
VELADFYVKEKEHGRRQHETTRPEKALGLNGNSTDSHYRRQEQSEQHTGSAA